MKTLLAFILTFALTNMLNAQSDCACCTEKHKQFHFWVGEWIVLDTLGNKEGENQITWSPREDGAVSQLWQMFDEENKLLQTAFLGIYHRKK